MFVTRKVAWQKCIVYILDMRETNLSGLDLNLLPPLKALLLKRSVTLAAADVGLSQPAMSRVLARLRAVLDDPLLVRVPGGFALTPHAHNLLPRVSSALENVKGLFKLPAFDPLTEQRIIRLVASDSQTLLLAPAIAARLALEAPHIQLKFESYSADTYARMQTGVADFAFALASTPLPPGALSEVIAEDRLALVMRREHPAANRDWTLKTYGEFSHACISMMDDGQSGLDTVLAAAGISRRVGFVSPHFMATLACVAQTNMITTISEAFALRFAKTFDLLVKRAPVPDAKLELVLVWSHIRENDPALNWFRGIVRDVARDLHVI